MAARTVSRLQSFFQEQAANHLRSIIRYDHDTFEIEYLRDDVSVRYNEQELLDAIDESRFDSLSTPVYEDAFADDHGEMSCLVQCFENVIEMNFIVSDGVGVAVGLDAAALAQSHGLVADAYDIITSDRDS